MSPLYGIHLLLMAGTIQDFLRAIFRTASRLFLKIHQIKVIISKAGRTASDLDTGAQTNGINLIDFRPMSLRVAGVEPLVITIILGRWSTLVISTVDTCIFLQKTIIDTGHMGAKPTKVNTSA